MVIKVNVRVRWKRSSDSMSSVGGDVQAQITHRVSHKPTTVFYWVLQIYKCTTNHSAVAEVAGSQ